MNPSRLTMLATLAILSACASAPPTAEDLIREMAPTKFVTPTPSHLYPGIIDLALAPGDRVIADCDAYFSDRLPEMDAQELAEFRRTVTCIYPAPGQFQASASHYNQQLAAKGFKDESGTYVQSAMRILCSPRGGVSFRVQAKFIPSFIVTSPDGEPVNIEGGGRLAHETLMVVFSPQGC